MTWQKSQFKLILILTKTLIPPISVSSHTVRLFSLMAGIFKKWNTLKTPVIIFSIHDYHHAYVNAKTAAT